MARLENRELSDSRQIKLFVGVFLGLLIGARCRRLDFSRAEPSKACRVLLVVAMTAGYLLTDKVIATRFSSKGTALHSSFARRSHR
jgi:hypothetical protein